MIDVESAPGAVFLSVCNDGVALVCEMTPARALEIADGLRRVAAAAQEPVDDVYFPVHGAPIVGPFNRTRTP